VPGWGSRGSPGWALADVLDMDGCHGHRAATLATPSAADKPVSKHAQLEINHRVAESFGYVRNF